MFIIKFHNDGLYEDYTENFCEYYFQNYEEAKAFAKSIGYEESLYEGIEGFNCLQRFEEDQSYDYSYAEILELKKPPLE